MGVDTVAIVFMVAAVLVFVLVILIIGSITKKRNGKKGSSLTQNTVPLYPVNEAKNARETEVPHCMATSETIPLVEYQPSLQNIFPAEPAPAEQTKGEESRLRSTMPGSRASDNNESSESDKGFERASDLD